MSQRLSEDDVRKVAKLGRLRLSDAEVHQYAEQLSKVLDYIAKLGELNVEGIAEMAHALDQTNVLRPDVAEPGLTVEQALANAPDADPPFFKVPKVIDDGSGA